MEPPIRQRLMENITLLWTLNEVPEKPSIDTTICKSDDSRDLPPKRERQLAENFALLCATTDDMLRVVAVCVEENSDQRGLTLRIASNTGDLSNIKLGLRGIAETLERARLRNDSRASMTQVVFRQIILLDESRILARLRSRHMEQARRTKIRPVLLDLLSNTLNDASIKCSGAAAKTNLRQARQSCEQLSKTFDAFEAARDRNSKSESEDHLVELMHQMFNFDTSNLDKVLQYSRILNPCTKNFLSLAIDKLGQYYGVATDLIAAARGSQSHLFQRVSIEILKEPDANATMQSPQGFDQVLQRNTGRVINRPTPQQKAILSTARWKFQSRLQSCATSPKIHAEIQLLLFYERNPDIMPPRIICSSKSACYLCNLFIRLHSRFQMPKTHGRIYDKWTLPGWVFDKAHAGEHISSVIDQFNRSIEAKIVQVVTNAETPFLHPNESTLRLPDPWSSASTLSQVLSQTPSRAPTLEVLRDPMNRSMPVPARSNATNSFKESSQNPSLDMQAPLHGDTTPFAYKNVSDSDSSRSSVDSFPLLPGRTVDYEMKSSPPEEFTVRTSSIYLQISWDGNVLNEEETGINRPEDTAAARQHTNKRHFIRVHRLPKPDSLDLSSDQNQNRTELIDLEALRCGEDQVIFSKDTALDSNLDRKPLALKCRDDILLLQWSLKEDHKS